MASVPLKYLFTVLFNDGEEYFQTPDDVAIRDPEPGCERGSAFSDVVPRLADVQLFQLSSHDTTLLLDLRDGHFELNDIPFSAGDPAVQFGPGTKRKLIYFRRTFQTRQTDVICTGQGPNGPTFEQVGEQRNAVYQEFHLGWEAEFKGKNHTVTIVLR
jgi:hypothetical protein